MEEEQTLRDLVIDKFFDTNDGSLDKMMEVIVSSDVELVKSISVSRFSMQMILSWIPFMNKLQHIDSSEDDTKYVDLLADKKNYTRLRARITSAFATAKTSKWNPLIMHYVALDASSRIQDHTESFLSTLQKHIQHFIIKYLPLAYNMQCSKPDVAD